jgi:hypothetical protein
MMLTDIDDTCKRELLGGVDFTSSLPLVAAVGGEDVSDKLGPNCS